MTISALIARASAAADLDPDWISFANALHLIRRAANAECPRAAKRARHNNYRVKKPGEPASRV